MNRFRPSSAVHLDVLALAIGSSTIMHTQKISVCPIYHLRFLMCVHTRAIDVKSPPCPTIARIWGISINDSTIRMQSTAIMVRVWLGLGWYIAYGW